MAQRPLASMLENSMRSAGKSSRTSRTIWSPEGLYSRSIRGWPRRLESTAISLSQPLRGIDVWFWKLCATKPASELVTPRARGPPKFRRTTSNRSPSSNGLASSAVRMPAMTDSSG